MMIDRIFKKTPQNSFRAFHSITSHSSLLPNPKYCVLHVKLIMK